MVEHPADSSSSRAPLGEREMVFRIHPAVGIARVGNSTEHVIAPETMAGAPVEGAGALTGGLPIRAGTEADPVRSSDLRDDTGALKRQAARFRIFAYERVPQETWPRGDSADVTEVTIGSPVRGRTVEDIIWTVHLANKKANTFVMVEDGPYQGIAAYEEGRLPPVRNPKIDDPGALQPVDKIGTLDDPTRVRQLTIDPGPRTVSGRNAGGARFDKATPATYYDASRRQVVTLDAYPKSFPADSFPETDAPSGPIDTLGELITDDAGHLLVLGGHGRAVGWRLDGPAPLLDDVNNNQWFDDTSDGPVKATLVLDDGSHVEVQGAWVTATDPSYAPQVPNIVSAWDDIYDVWVRELDLAPDIYEPELGGFQSSYLPTFDDQIAPIFKASALQQWTVNLSSKGASAHAQVGAIEGSDDPATTVLAGLDAIFRDPFKPGEDDDNTALMPLHLGGANESFLTLRQTQYFFLQRWNEGRESFRPGSGPPLGPGEMLDKATLVNCLGGRFSPGIDLTFVMREHAVYVLPWQSSGRGPFRINQKPLAYADLPPDNMPLLTGGYVPRHVEDGLEPGDLTKFMALPWHTDYNSCATHPPSPNPPGNRTLFWSWPAQRPVAVYAAADVTWSEQRPDFGAPPAARSAQLPAQRWAVRGLGTDSPDAENWGRYQDRLDMLQNWQRIGVVVQAPQIDTSRGSLPDDWYLETQGLLLDTDLTPVQPFPNHASMIDPGNALELDPRELFFKLLNINEYPGVLPDARAYVDAWLAWAENFSNSPGRAPADQLFFPYTEDAFQARLDFMYQALADAADAYDPAADHLIKTYDDAVTYIIQYSPFNLIDGAWLRHVGTTGPIEESRALLYSVSMDELGDGDVSMNHCNIWLDLCHSVGYYPSDIYSSDFAFDPQFLDSAFTVPAFELAISQFTRDYYPELLGMTLQLEWLVLDIKPTRDMFEYFGINPHFFVMHIGIDNAVNGHGARAAEAVRLYLREQQKEGGAAAAATAWRRIWNGFVVFGAMGTLGEDFAKLMTNPPSLREQMIAMFKRKAPFGSRNHQDRMVGGTRINEWFNKPGAFLDALLKHDYITPGDWPNSRMNALLSFETGPMFRVFTDDEIALWASYVNDLANPAPPPPPPVVPPARAMAGVIDQLRPVQRGVLGHRQNMLADENGTIHTIAWWFQQPTAALMEALASPVNDVITPGSPEQSRFCTELIAPTGPMGSVFNLPASPPNTGTCRDVVHAWVAAGCPIPVDDGTTLRLTSPAVTREAHPTGVIYGMGTIH